MISYLHGSIYRLANNFNHSFVTVYALFVVIVEQDNQGDLEMATEMLSEYMERDITNSSLQDLKIIVMDKTK